MLVVASKIDVAQDATRVDSLREMAREAGLPFYAISSVTGQGMEELKYAMAQGVAEPASLITPTL